MAMWTSSEYIQTGHGYLMPEVMALLLHSRLHCAYNLSMLERNFFCSFQSKQFMLFRNDRNQAVGFVNWTYLSEDQLAKVFEANGVVPFDCWHGSGDILFFPEFIAPLGQARSIVSYLRNKVFPHQLGLAIHGDAINQPSTKKIGRFSGQQTQQRRWSDRVEELIAEFSRAC